MKTLLIADDDKHLLHVMARFLESAGYRVLSARNGTEALSSANAHRPDLLILDVALPLMTGEQVALRFEGSAPILFISGRDLDRVEGLPLERYRSLAKPADLDDVLACVREMLGESAP